MSKAPALSIIHDSKSLSTVVTYAKTPFDERMMTNLAETLRMKIFPSVMTWFTVCCILFFLSGIFSGESDVLKFPGIEVIKKYNEPIFIFVFPVVSGLFWLLIDAVSSTVTGINLIFKGIKSWAGAKITSKKSAVQKTAAPVIAGDSGNRPIKLMFAKESITQFIALGSIEVSISVLSAFLKVLVRAPISWHTIVSGLWPAIILWIIALFWDWRLSEPSPVAQGAVPAGPPAPQLGQGPTGPSASPSVTPAAPQAATSAAQTQTPSAGGAKP